MKQQKTIQKTVQKTVHLFGEMDLNLSLSRKKIVKEASRIANACRYAGDNTGDTLTLLSNDYDKVKIKFDGNDKVVNVTRSTDNGKTWETLNFKGGIFEVSAETLAKYNKKIGYGTQQKLPMSQGSMMNEIAKKYKIPAIRWGYHLDLIGLETKKQFLIWRDCGPHAEFLGIIDKDTQSTTQTTSHQSETIRDTHNEKF